MGISREVKRSSLSYANNHRSYELFEHLFYHLVNKLQEHQSSHNFKFKNPLYSIDATVIDLCIKHFPWADFRKTKVGIKMLVKLNHSGFVPSNIVISNARGHEKKDFFNLSFEKNEIIAFDRGFSIFNTFLS